MTVILVNDRLTGPENRYIDNISGASQRMINILVSTHILSGVRNPIKALFSVLDHYNMLKHTKYTFQVVRHVPVPKNRQIDYISGNSQRRINILVSTHIFSVVRNPIKALFSVLDHYKMLKHTKYTFQVVRHVPVPENRQIDYISGNNQRRINILVSTHIFSGVRNPIKALFSVLDHYNMLKHTKYTFQVVRHMPVPENCQIDYISGNSQRRINILVSTHIFSGVRNPIKVLFSVLDHYNMLKHTKYTFQMVRHIPKFQLMATNYVYG